MRHGPAYQEARVSGTGREEKITVPSFNSGGKVTMKKILFALALVVAFGGVAQACTTHGLVQAATLDAMYGGSAAMNGFTFTFDHHSYAVVAPNGDTYSIEYVGAGDYITPHLTNIENFIEAHLAVAEAVSNTSSSSSETHNETTEQCDDYFG
jgi:hypothetical protein